MGINRIDKGYNDFVQNIVETQVQNQLNLADNWHDLIDDIWNNRGNCTCQTHKVKCPCDAGIARAKAGGECYCGLFIGHN